MSYSDISKVVVKAYKYFVIRPLKRFNVDNRAQKYLGPEAPKFKPAPKAIKYEVEKIEHGTDDSFKRIGRESSSGDASKRLSSNEDLIADNSSLVSEVKKLVVIKIPEGAPHASSQINSNELNQSITGKPSRPLPVARNLPLQDPLNIWKESRVPYGRLDLERLQELMYNRLADRDYWSAKVVSEKYKLNIDHAINLTKYVSAHKIVCSPNVYKYLQLTGLKNELFQQIKGFAIKVDESLRTENDKHLDIGEAEKRPEASLHEIKQLPPVEPLKVASINAAPSTEGRRRLASQMDNDRRKEAVKRLTISEESKSK